MTRGYRIVIALVLLEAVTVAALSVAGSAASRVDDQARQSNRRLVREMLLTDLALSTGTSYCRHPSQTDLFAPYGDHPSAIEHFPAGSIMAPPAVSTPSTATGPGP
jgi:hypothetical protein